MTTHSFYLELGDVIQITSPKNETLNNQVFFIDYIDNTKMKLINTETLDIITLKINNDGYIGDGTITHIIIKSRSEFSGYSRQHGLLPSKWINIHFGGELPFIITGEITNLQNDMIEITTIDNDI